jgi:predicted membrane-bound spermidine synthase
MRAFANLMSAVIVAGWISAIALISIQNITPISLKFLTFSTIPLPFGILLAFGVGIGILLGAIIPILMPGSPRRNRRPKQIIDPLEDWDEFEE